MTNLLATILITITTNWTTVSTTYPAPCGMTGCCAYHMVTVNQVGTVTSNTLAVTEWKGRKVETVLESVQIGSEQRSAYR